MNTALETRHKIIRLYFKAFRGRVDFLAELAARTHQVEATLLASCYVEALGARFWPNEPSSRRKFVRTLTDHGYDRRLQLVHPKHLQQQLESSRARKDQSLASSLRSLEMKSYAPTPERFLEWVQADLAKNQAERLKEKLWDGTLASLVYVHIRSPAVHSGGAVAIEPGLMSEDGRDLPRLDWSLLNTELLHLLPQVEQHCLDHPELFGPMHLKGDLPA